MASRSISWILYTRRRYIWSDKHEVADTPCVDLVRALV
jgi:hypothetical protein